MNASRWAIAVGIILLAAVVVGILLLPRPSAVPASDSTATSLFRSQPRLLDAGTYLLDRVLDGRTIMISVPANWTSLEHSRGNALLVKTLDAEPFGTAPVTVLLGTYSIDSVFGDPCHDAKPIAPAPLGLDAVIDAITHATSVQAGPVSDTQLGGLPAKTFDLTNTINMDDCRTSPFNQWTFRNGAGIAVGNGTSSGPGDHQRIWLLDVDGEILLVNADTGANDNPNDVSELFEIVDGLRFE
jgi:hypothetical protein